VSENARRHNPFIREVIPNGVDTQVFRPGIEAKSSAPSILFVGALDGRKRGRFLLNVFSTVIRSACPDAELMFVGASGPAASGVTYYTGIDDDQLARLYNRAWVYASPSTYEGFGLPYLEAMSCGTAVVAAPNPGSSEVLANGRYGTLVTHEGFGAAILELLNDAGARHRLERGGVERAKAFSAEIMIDRYETLLRRLIHADARRIAAA
jgi:glycosyltransferase involved in cell wall biosynthesis